MSEIDKSILEVAKEVAVPFYNDALSPVSREVGKGLESVARMANAGIFLAEDCVQALTSVLRMTGQQLLCLPPERVSVERPRVAAKVIEEARYAIEEPEVQQMFASLLSAAMDKERANLVHPAYVEVIRQLDPDEAKILKFMHHLGGKAPTLKFTRSSQPKNGLDREEMFSMTMETEHVNLICEDSGCTYVENESIYLANLKRLDLITGVASNSFVEFDVHTRIKESVKIEQIKQQNPHINIYSYSNSMYVFTRFGHALVKACFPEES
ncbi:DUF4393 domain-containing protein [Vibrio cholerae]|nr:DUF4393 domain-containing protein [Vibrio cholerae]EJL6950351.1 DUF4393 domain-containing protein [Vibrio cholerae]